MVTVQDLPAINACLNGLSAFWLSIGFLRIRRGERTAHRNCMLAALFTSLLFLVGYLTYHFNVGTLTRFREPGWFRPIYLGILLTHTLLAGSLVALVPVTFVLALRRRFERHRRWARWTWPVWMYVSVTGVVIYLLLYRIFPQQPGG